MGPKKKQVDIPVLNFCPNLKEIISFGQIEFNTMLNVNGKNRDCGYSFVNEEDMVAVENSGEKRNKKETAEEKRLRKQKVKEMKSVCTSS